MKNETLNLKKILEYQRKFVADREWSQFHTPKNLVMALSGEMGELSELFQWLTEAESTEAMADPVKAEKIRHEVADVLYYLCRLVDVLGIDLEESFWEKTRQNERKYPVELARGNAKKYTELGKK